MSVKVNGLIEIYSELSSSPVDWLLANVGDKIRIEIPFEASRYSLASISNPIIINLTDGVIGTGWAKSTNNAFLGMKVGDTITWGNYVTPAVYETKTIVQKLSNNLVQFNAAFTFGAPGDDFSSEESIFSLVKPFTGIKYRWNFIENAESLNFFSKVDGSEQLLKMEYIEADDTTVLDMEFVGAKDYQIGSATIEGVSIQTTPYYANNFKLIHYTFITPFMLASQRLDLINGIPPSYFTNEKCLKYVYNIQALYVYTNPSEYEQLTASDVAGNTGWLGENFNNNDTNYSIDTVEFKQYPSFIAIPNLEYTDALQFFSFKIKNPTDSPFTGTTKLIVKFCKVAFDTSEYTGTGRPMNENFVIDRVVLIDGDTGINGENYGTGYQVFVAFNVVNVSTSEITVEGYVDFGADAFARIQESELPTYQIDVSIQNDALDTDVADKVTLPVDIDEYYISNSDPGMIITDGRFLTHTESDIETEGSATLDVFPEDEVVNYNRFYIDKNGRLSDEILLKSISMKVKAKNSVTLEEFVLDQQAPFDLTGLGLDASGLQYANILLNRPFHIPAAEIRKKIVFKRRGDLDAGNLYYYEALFPFLVRWEYFIELASVNSAFFDTAEPFNGKNQFWDRFAHLGDWGLYYEIKILATKNGVLQAYTEENQFTSNDWDSNSSWTPNSIKAYDAVTADELYDPITDKKYIYGYKNTRIEALFTNITPPIDIDNYVVNFGIESFEGTGVAERTRMSSKWASDADTWFKSIDASSKTVLTLVSTDTVKAEVYVDFTKIPDKPIFKIAARLYDVTVAPIGKKTEAGLFKKTEDGIVKTKEIE